MLAVRCCCAAVIRAPARASAPRSSRRTWKASFAATVCPSGSCGVCHGRPRHPQTQGKDERLPPHPQRPTCSPAATLLASCTPNRTSTPTATSITTSAPTRPRATPCPPAATGPRPWRAADQGFDYAPGAILRQVKGKGEITFANRFFYLGAAFAAHQVALEATETDGLYHARLHAHAIGQIDLRLPTSKAKGCYCPPGQNHPPAVTKKRYPCSRPPVPHEAGLYTSEPSQTLSGTDVPFPTRVRCQGRQFGTARRAGPYLGGTAAGRRRTRQPPLHLCRQRLPGPRQPGRRGWNLPPATRRTKLTPSSRHGRARPTRREPRPGPPAPRWKARARRWGRKTLP